MLGPALFKESTGDRHCKYRKESMEWLRDRVTKKLTRSMVNGKVKESQELQGIDTYVYQRDVPPHDY